MVDLDLEARVDYTQHSNKKLITIPLVVLGLALLVIAGWWVMTGTPVSFGFEFTGGTELQLEAEGGEDAILDAYDGEVSAIRAIATEDDQYIVIFQEDVETQQTDELVSTAEDAGFTVLSVQGVTASFGQSIQLLALIGVIIAFAGMSIVVLLLFRTFIPSIAVVVSAFSDIVVPIAVMNLAGINLSIGTVAALLMLIGYSVDSDILLTNHVLRRGRGSEDFYDSTYRAMRTGVTMTVTAISAMVVMAVVASLFGIGLLTAIGTVLAIGLVVDLMNTYMFNVGLLRWYQGLNAP